MPTGIFSIRLWSRYANPPSGSEIKRCLSYFFESKLSKQQPIANGARINAYLSLVALSQQHEVFSYTHLSILTFPAKLFSLQGSKG